MLAQGPHHGNSKTKMCASAPTFLFPSDASMTWTQLPRDIPTGWAFTKEEVLRPQGVAPRNRGYGGAGGTPSGSWGPPSTQSGTRVEDKGGLSLPSSVRQTVRHRALSSRRLVRTRGWGHIWAQREGQGEDQGRSVSGLVLLTAPQA